MSHRCCPIDPDDHTLLFGGQLLVDVDAFLQVDEHGHERHEGEHRVEDKAEDVQTYREQMQTLMPRTLKNTAPGGRLR